MDSILNLILYSITQVWITFTHNWPFLLASVLIAGLLKVYMDPHKVSAFLMRYRKAGVIGATAVAVTTPLCSCGTTAIILGMMANMMPWAPIVAFMVSSPLTSPEELIYSAGLFGWPFALAFFISSILLGLLGGTLASFVESKGWLAGQARMALDTLDGGTPECCAVPGACSCDAAPIPASACSCSESTNTCGCGDTGTVKPTSRLREVAVESFKAGKRLLVMFLGFAFIGYFLNGLIPAAWVAAVFGAGQAYSVPLAATLGLPLYINTEASLPLIRALIDAGMSQGAALAFLITGAGTSIGALAGALTIARWRVIGLVIATLWVGAVLMGYAYNLIGY